MSIVNYTRSYSEAVKYMAEEKAPLPTDPDLQRMLKNFEFDYDSRGVGKNSDRTLRGVLADKLQELGRDEEAALLRDNHPVRVVGSEYDNDTFPLRKGGKLFPDYPSHTDYGGYPLVYSCERPDRNLGTGARILCPDCVNNLALSRAESIANGEEVEHQHPRSYVAAVHEEGSPIECDDCNNQIESAYGDPENPEED